MPYIWCVLPVVDTSNMMPDLIVLSSVDCDVYISSLIIYVLSSVDSISNNI